jgi:ABC-type Fe3+-citrate transport system substrate-binding protein
MSDKPEHRQGADRRRRPRGGRRPEDRDGLAPLVLIVGQDGATERSEAILAKLKFAVSTTSTVDDALRVISTLKPDLVVAGEFEGRRIQTEIAEHVPMVVRTDAGETPEALIDNILRAIRTGPALN